MKVALYARYSSDQQRAASIDDQLRLCREFAARQEWTVVADYTDPAVSGVTLMRAGIQSLLRDAAENLGISRQSRGHLPQFLHSPLLTSRVRTAACRGTWSVSGG
jgi:DNA invertase Pin-like site-specific DNA recombinase